MWNTVASSKYLEEYENVEVGPVSPKRFRKLHNALCSAKSVLKTGTPVQPTFLKNRKKQQVIRREEMDKMYYENKILLKKMDEIQNRHVNKPKLYSGKRKQFNVSDNRYPITEGLMNRKYKIAEQRKVDEENKVQIRSSRTCSRELPWLDPIMRLDFS